MGTPPSKTCRKTQFSQNPGHPDHPLEPISSSNSDQLKESHLTFFQPTEIGKELAKKEKRGEKNKKRKGIPQRDSCWREKIAGEGQLRERDEALWGRSSFAVAGERWSGEKGWGRVFLSGRARSSVVEDKTALPKNANCKIKTARNRLGGLVQEGRQRRRARDGEGQNQFWGFGLGLKWRDRK